MDPVSSLDNYPATVTPAELALLDSLAPSGTKRSLQGRRRREPKYVEFHPDDDPSLYEPTLFEHPDEYVPYEDWEGRIIYWGLSPIIPQGELGAGQVDYGDTQRLMTRRMASNLYSSWSSSELTETPEQQFVNYLVEKQITKLQSMDLGDLPQRDYTLKMVVDQVKDANGHDRIWREFRVSGGLSIAALADKVLTPLMGWVRNYHAHAFTVHKDGAVYGPTESRAIDMMHPQSIGWGAVPETSNRGVWTLAHLLQAEGETMLWLYDYGDRWTHLITVEEIAPVSTSTGKVAVLDGAGACPREDCGGHDDWVEEIEKLQSPDPRVRAEVLANIQHALNYKHQTIGASFDPDNFDLVQARARVHAALASPDSVWSGPKSFVHPITKEGMRGNPGTLPDRLKKGQTLERTWDGDGRFMQEVTSSNRDKKLGACCWTCGTPHGLSACSACRKTMYCGSECQRLHWKAGHKLQCKSRK
ncbi:hypothetical protein BV25DRAFT_693414 [Artomyces pyxidatus]|uniref:Uncharacterized protein n=1 Tax=Artomyces pyxidatus TaxID=48021 RepID=A0ACB8T1T8_9AGAM|nr:hypothetical protein BV25DRAFT_693414 [Artomyces pyxidatus]